MTLRPEEIDPLDPETVECPYPYYDALRSHAPVHRVPGHDWFLVSTYDTAIEVLKDPERFSSTSGVGVPSGPGGQHPPPPNARVHTLLTADPPVHGHYRTLVNRAFSARRVAEMEGAVRASADELISTILPRGVVELGTEFAVPLPLVVICDMLGLPRSDLRQFKTWSDGIAQLGGLVDEQQRAEIQRGNVAFAGYLAARVEERRRDPLDDIMTDLITLTFDPPDGDRRPLTDDEILSILPQLLVAGTRRRPTRSHRASRCCWSTPSRWPPCTPTGR